MKIVFFGCESWEKTILEKAFPRDELFFSKDKLKAANAAKYNEFESVSVFIDSKIDEQALAKLPKLKLIATRSTGFNHIDIEACKKRKITVCNVPTYGENTVAEHAFALILGLSRKLVPCVERARTGNFTLRGLRGFDLQGKTLGVVGCGNIGRHVVRIANGLEMNVLVFDMYKDLKFAQKMGFKYVGLEELLKKSDIVTLHVPYNQHTHHLIDSKKIALMKKGALLINTSRGGIVETDALVKALQSGLLSGAGLDVLEEEDEMIEELQLLCKDFVQKCDLKTLLENHVLLQMPNVLVTPHNAFNTQEALERILNTTIDNIKGFKNGKQVNVVS